MFFKNVIGQCELKDRLRGMVDSGRIPHALLLTGKPGVGKLPLALAMAQYICCEHHADGESCGKCPSCVQLAKLAHPDVHFVFPIAENKSEGITVCDDKVKAFREAVLRNPYLTVDEWMDEASSGKSGLIYAKEADEIIRKLSFKPYQGDRKVMIIWQPEKMHEACSNKVLKILEEPPLDTIFILVSDNPEKLLSTIRSRCQMVAVPPVADDDISAALHSLYEIDDDEEKFLVRNAMGSWGRLLELVQHNDETRVNFELFVRMMRMAWLLDIKSIKAFAEEVATLSRDRQVLFFQNAQRLIRENFILRLGVDALNYMSRDERAFAAKFAQFIHERNVVEIMNELELAEAQIAQNCNTKIIMFHLEVVLYKLLKRPRV